MAENMVRCRRCHEVFDANEGPCPKCGTAYQPPVAQPQVYDGLYSERYAPAESLTSAAPETATAPLRRRNTTGLMIGTGAVLIASALLVAILFELGAVGGPNPTAYPAVLVGGTAAPTPEPSLPSTIELTLQQLNDPMLSAHITVAGSIVDKTVSTVVKFDGHVSKGNEWGNIQVAAVKNEIRLVDGTYFIRVVPGGRWSIGVAIPAYWALCPVFGIKTTRELTLVGQEVRNGQPVIHFRSTGWWSPDANRLAMTDVSGLAIKPDVTVLDLWTATDGTPVAAAFSGTNSATDGTKLVDIEMTYTFSDVGVEQPIDAPGPGWSPSPGT